MNTQSECFPHNSLCCHVCERPFQSSLREEWAPVLTLAASVEGHFLGTLDRRKILLDLELETGTKC